MARYIFITGGVVSSLGKGLASAALGSLLQARGFSVRLRKLDPYLNVDPGTFRLRADKCKVSGLSKHFESALDDHGNCRISS